MTRVLLIFALLCVPACTFTHVALERHDHPPTVQLSPAMAKLDRTEQSSPWWTAAGDTTLLMGGFMAGPVTENEPINLAGLALSGLVFASLGATIALWGHL